MYNTLQHLSNTVSSFESYEIEKCRNSRMNENVVTSFPLSYSTLIMRELGLLCLAQP